MSTTSAEIIPEYGTTYLPMNNKNTTTMYINGPSVSTPQTVTHQLPNGYATTTNGYSAAPEFTNLTPLMSGPLPPTSQFTAQQILSNTSFLNDHNNPSSASSSRTKLQNIGLGEDSGISSHNGSLLMSTAGLPQMNGFGSPQMEIKLEDDLDAMPRDRCNTWPLRRPTLDINAQTSPLIHDRIPEEETIYDSSENLSQSGMLGPGDIQSNNGFSNDFVQIGSPDDLSQDGGNDSPNSSAKKATTRRNAWGNMSYADLITQAILNSPEKRLTLSQVYEWMVQNVPYFRDKGDSNSSAGWKMKKRMESIDDNFFAQPRERCHTWPMPQYPGSIISSQSSTPYHSPLSSGFPSTSSINNSNNNIHHGPLPSISYFCGGGGQQQQHQNINQPAVLSLPYNFQQQRQYPSTNSGYNFVNFNIPNQNSCNNNAAISNNKIIIPKKEIRTSPTKSNTSQEIPCDPAPSSVGPPPSSSPSILRESQEFPSTTQSPEKPKRKRIRKKDPNHVTQKKPNAWGEESYSDLIMKALEAAPDGRMKLNEIYQWFIDNVKYFSERAGQEEASGWKNSIRHNLSLHSRFMRIQNEGAGKSSWWVINPDAKPGRNPRRRAQTMESTTKAKLERSRRGARKRIEMGAIRSGGSSAIGSTASIVSHEIFNDLDDPLNSNFDTFRGRTHSNLSAIGNTTRISPTVDRFDEFDFPPWGEQQRSSNPEVNEIMGRTGDMRLENNGSDFKTDFRGIPTTDSSTLLGDFPGPKLEFDDPPPYQELNPLRPPMPMQQPMMRTSFNPQRTQQMRMTNQPNGYYVPPPVYNNQPMMALSQQLNQQQQWTPMNGGYSQMSGLHTQNGQNPQMFEHHQQNQLPMDLEGLTLPDTMEFGSDVETILRHELSQTQDQQIHFDL